MMLRRPLGIFTLLAMMHFIIVGTAAACVTPPAAPGAASSVHIECQPESSHSKRGGADRPAEVPCCTALASCATAPLLTRTALFLSAAPEHAVASAIAERAPSAERPAPELPPPRA